MFKMATTNIEKLNSTNYQNRSHDITHILSVKICEISSKMKEKWLNKQ